MARKTTAEIRIKATDEASGPTKKAASGFDKLGTSIEGSGNSATKAQGRLSKFGSFLSSKFVVTLGDVANGVRAAFAAIKDASDLSSQTNALKLALAEQGQSFDEFIGKLRKVSRSTVSTADLIKSSSKALLLGIPAEEISQLLEIARASAIATGQSVQAAFDDIATGIGRSSPLILDNLGIIVKIGKANEDYAKTLGKTATALTAAEQKQALLNAVLKVGVKRIELFGESADATAESLQQGTAAMGDLRIAAGRASTVIVQTLGVALVGITAVVLRMASAFQHTRLVWNNWMGDMEDQIAISESISSLNKMIEKVDGVGVSLSLSIRTQLGFKTGMEDMLNVTREATTQMEKTKKATDELGSSAAAATTGTDALTESVDEMGDEMDAAAISATGSLIPALATTETTLRSIVEATQLAALGFDALAASQGRAAAVEAQQASNLAQTGGSGVHFFGTRINVPGGSRLVRPPGSPFSTIGSGSNSNWSWGNTA